jgi:hypothetical protein
MIPSIHHPIERIIDSRRKILSISRARIHIARSIPISLVRSAIPANITFIIPIPETTSTIMATQVKRSVMVEADSCAAVTLDH